MNGNHEQTPLIARIVGLVEVWDALRTDHIYRRAWTYDKAREYIIEQSGKAFDPKIVARFNKAVFYPRPDVDSAVARLDVYERPPVDVPDADMFFRVVKAGFGQKRKQLKNAIAEGLHMEHDQAAVLLEAAGIDPKRRAETLALPEWAAITRKYAAQTS